MDAPPAGASVAGEADDGTHEPLDQLVAVAYQELRIIAHSRLRALRAVGGNETLSTTALVHEVYLKLLDQSSGSWHDRSHFFAIASLAMRHLLVDCAKARNTLKRGGVRHRVDLDDEEIGIDV